MRQLDRQMTWSGPARGRTGRGLSMSLALAILLCSPLPGIAGDASGLLFETLGQPFPGKPATQQVSQPAAGTAPSQPSTAEVPQLDPVQTAALYYYAKERQTGRVEAEIARLQALHPGFVPPQDLYIAADRIVPNETSLWEMFAADDFTGIDAEIIRRKAADPAWKPTQDFDTKLSRKKLRVRMQELAQAGDWLAVADISAGIDCSTEADVNLVWTGIDAFSATGDRQGLARMFRGLLDRQGKDRLSDEHLVVTLQKALRDFPASEIRVLAAGLWPQENGAYLPSALKLDLARKEVADFNASMEATPVAVETVGLLALEARTSRRPEDLSLLGWHDLKLENPAGAEEWFTAAMEIAPDPENAKGMYLSLARQAKDKKAFEFASLHLDVLSDDSAFLLNVLSPRFGKPGQAVVSEDAVLAYSTAILETGAADHAEILGWYAYNSRQYEAAEAWFRQSYDWEASADRLKGLALTMLRQGRKKDYAALKADQGSLYPDIWPEIAAAPTPGHKDAASVAEPTRNVKTSYVRHFEARDYPSCLREIDRLGASAQKPAVALIRGWCELGLKRFNDARASFEVAMSGSEQQRSDAVYGASLSLLGARLTDEAEALITTWPLSQARERELRSEIYVQRARSAFERQQFERTLTALDARAALVDESRDLMQMRAWAHYHLGQPERAKAIFRQLNTVIRDTAALAAIEMINTKEGN